MSPVTFASIRLEKEYEELQLKRPELRVMVDEFADKATDDFGWVPCITSIWRSPAEQAEVDRNSAVMGRPKGSTSPHSVWQAVDFRTRGVRQAIVDGMVKWAQERWEYNPADPSKPVAYAKPHGDGPHLHLQVKPGVTRLRDVG